MMGALFLNPSSVAPIKLIRVSDKSDRCFLSRKKNVVYCQGSGNVVKSSGFSSVLTEREALASTDHSAALRDAGNLVLSPNGKSQAEIAGKDLVTYEEPSTPLGEVHDGIGIVKFLRGKGFLITGATGFLAKGIMSIKASQLTLVYAV